MFKVIFGSTNDDSEITLFFKLRDLDKEFENSKIYINKPAIEVIKHYISKKRLSNITNYDGVDVFDVRNFEFINKTELGTVGLQMFREAINSG
jgi:hypothetical protein